MNWLRFQLPGLLFGSGPGVFFAVPELGRGFPAFLKFFDFGDFRPEGLFPDQAVGSLAAEWNFADEL